MDTSKPNAEQSFQIGLHRFRFEPPDVLFMHFEGPVQAAEFHEFYATALKLKPEGQIFLVRDARHGGLLDSKMRTAVINTADPERLAAIITYGSSFQLRVVVTMLAKAMRVIRKSVPLVVFVDSEDDARAWIATHRKASNSA
jgi:hypothetical protein